MYSRSFIAAISFSAAGRATLLKIDFVIQDSLICNVVDPNVYLDPEPEICPILDPDSYIIIFYVKIYCSAIYSLKNIFSKKLCKINCT